MMKLFLKIIVLTLLFTGVKTAYADAPVMTPGQVQACTVNPGASMNDVNAILASARAWLTAGGHDFEMWMAMPHYKPATGYNFDFLLLGFWPNHAEEMSGLQSFYTTAAGQQLGANMQQVMTCNNQHVNNIQVRPDIVSNLDSAFGYMFDCTLAKGKGPSDVNTAFQGWNAYLDANNIDHGVTAMFPSYGANEERAGTFKFLWGGDFENVGKSTAFLTNTDAMATWTKLTEKTYTCDNFSRGYVFQRISAL